MALLKEKYGNSDILLKYFNLSLVIKCGNTGNLILELSSIVIVIGYFTHTQPHTQKRGSEHLSTFEIEYSIL